MKHKRSVYAPELVEEHMEALAAEAGIMCRGAGITAPRMIPDDRVTGVHPDYRTGTLRVNPGVYYRPHETIRHYLAYGIASLLLGQPRIRIYAAISVVVALWAGLLLQHDGTVLAYSAMSAAVLQAVALMAIAIRREIRLLREIDRITYARSGPPS